MKKIAKRSVSVLIVAVLVILGLVSFIGSEFENGRGWALYFATFNSDAEGTVNDTNGELLASFGKDHKSFSPDGETRLGNYHVTGDYWGRTGSGVISRFWSNAQNYDFVNGTTGSSLNTLDLTIDADLNRYIYKLLRAGGKGAVMISNYKTGEVLALVSSPSIDPLDETSEPEEGTYVNRCLAATFIPGSTFKLITAAAALESIPDIEQQRFTCSGESEIAGVKIKCTDVHGEQTFAQAMANSCNCAFADITVQVGQREMVEHVREYGFLDPHDLDGIPSFKGNFPLEFVGDPELAWAGIGQSVDQVCPYTMLRYVSAIANGGRLTEPTMVKHRYIKTDTDAEMQLLPKEDPFVSQLVAPETAKRLRELMINNVETHYEGSLNFPGLTLGAKTGTAEINEEVSHSWFTGFLIDDAHPYAFVAVVEEGGFGLENAGKMMNDILHYATGKSIANTVTTTALKPNPNSDLFTQTEENEQTEQTEGSEYIS